LRKPIKKNLTKKRRKPAKALIDKGSFPEAKVKKEQAKTTLILEKTSAVKKAVQRKYAKNVEEATMESGYTKKNNRRK
jgi:hypothetical protein